MANNQLKCVNFCKNIVIGGGVGRGGDDEPIFNYEWPYLNQTASQNMFKIITKYIRH